MPRVKLVAHTVAVCSLAVGLLASAPASAQTVRLLAFGDSLTHGYGLPDGDTFPDQLEAALQADGYDIEVLNAGVSGDTTAGGLARVDWALFDAPDAVLVALGANDFLRGIDPATSRDNLAGILDRLQAEGVPALLAGMYAPRNLDETYTTAFDGMYPDLAEAYDVPLYPFFLNGVALVPDLNQDDGIHPNAAGVAVIVDQMAPFVATALIDAGVLSPVE